MIAKPSSKDKTAGAKAAALFGNVLARRVNISAQECSQRRPQDKGLRGIVRGSIKR